MPRLSDSLCRHPGTSAPTVALVVMCASMILSALALPCMALAPCPASHACVCSSTDATRHEGARQLCSPDQLTSGVLSDQVCRCERGQANIGAEVFNGSVQYCGALDIASRGICGRWIPVKDAPADRLQYNSTCPFIRMPRYNCVELQESNRSSADKFHFEPCKPHQSLGCTVPTLRQSLAKLAGMRVLSCGDSHSAQLFYEALCLFSNTPELAAVNDLPRPWLTNPVYDPVNYYPPRFVDNWRKSLGILNSSASFLESLRDRLRSMPNGSERLQNMNGRRLSTGRARVQYARFENGFELWSAYLRDSTPRIQGQEEKACVDAAVLTSNRSADLLGRHKASPAEINSIDVILANDFLNLERLYAVLKMRGYKGRVVTIPKFGTGYSANKDKLDTIENLSRRTFRAKEGVAQTKRVGLVSHNLGSPLDKLIKSRLRDAKAPMFPLTYVNANGTRVTCRNHLSDSLEPCLGHDWHACRQENCHPETHFCMPGPLNAILRYVFAALASPTSWVH